MDVDVVDIIIITLGAEEEVAISHRIMVVVFMAVLNHKQTTIVKGEMPTEVAATDIIKVVFLQQVMEK